LSGFAFSQAINSFRSVAGMAFLATINSGALAIRQMGWKSLTRSYGRLNTAPLRTCVGMPPWPNV
jgi:hypothetical protein